LDYLLCAGPLIHHVDSLGYLLIIEATLLERLN
jgi:hypothetical protein